MDASVISAIIGSDKDLKQYCVLNWTIGTNFRKILVKMLI